MNLEPIFPSLLATEMTDIDCDNIIKYAKQLEKDRPTYHENSWQSGPIDIDTPELSELVSYVREKIPHFAELYGLNERAAPKISDMWINRNSNAVQNAYNVEPHLHANHWLSFVFYPMASPTSSKLVFLNPNNSVEYALPAGLLDYSTTYNSHRMTIQPETGLMVAFPSWLMHWVDHSQDTAERYSIAINVTLSHINTNDK
jgi:uncharacterized protein (TIGR02466 family)